MQFNNFFRRMLPIAAAVAISSASFNSFAQSYRVRTGGIAGSEVVGSPVTTLQAAVNLVPTNDVMHHIILESANDTLTYGVSIAAGQNITLTSDIGRTIVQKENYKHFGVSGKLTLENIVLSGMGYHFEDIGVTFILPPPPNNKECNGGISVEADGIFTMEAGAVIEKCLGHEGTVSLSANDGVFIMNDGEIRDNKVTYSGGAVYVDQPNYFEMNGGQIHHNMCPHYGGGIGLGHEAVVTLNGGEIYNNSIYTDFRPTSYAAYNTGGGIGGYGINSILTINSGVVIRDNTAGTGGGVAMLCGTFNMLGGEIRDNTSNGTVADFFYKILGGFADLNVSDILNYKISQGLDDIQLAMHFLGITENELNDLMALYDCDDVYEVAIKSVGAHPSFTIGCGGGVGISNIVTLNMTGGKIYDNHATNDGGGIFTLDFSYEDPMLAYNNINIYNKDSVYGNTAGQGSLVPNIPTWDKGFDISLLTNHQINYRPITTTIDTVCFTDSVTLAVTVIDGGENPTYQWFRNGVAVDDSNDSIFKYKAVAGHKDTILCKVYPDIECPEDVYSQIMIVEMLDSLALEQPDNDEVCVGEKTKSVTFSGTYDYVKWEVTTGNGTAIGMPANSGIGDISAFTTTNSGIVTITATPVSGKCEGISKTFSITVNPKQKIKATIKVR